MAILDLIFKKTPITVGTLEIDATVTEQHNAEVEISDHPVEYGSDISDHIRKKPDRITLTGVISNTPLVSFNFSATGQDRAVTAWQELKRLQYAAELVDVVTPLETYYDMMLESVTATREVKTGQALHFTATLRTVLTVESQTVAAPADVSGKPKDLGKQPTPPATPPQQQSLLSKGASGLLGLF